MELIRDSEGLGALVAAITNSNRKRPICVITATIGEELILVDGESLSRELASLADFFQILSPDLTRDMANRLPENTAVFGGAVRIYRHDFAADPSPKLHKLFNIRDREHGLRLIAKIEEQIWASANAAGLLQNIVDDSVEAEGDVVSIMGSRAFIKLDSGDIAAIQQETFAPDVPLDWLLEKGQRLKGTFGRELKVFIPKVVASSTEELVRHFGLNSVTLGLVKSADRQSARIALTPAQVFDVAKEEITGNPFDVISSYLDVGDVVAVRIYRHPEGKIRLRMNDIDDDEPILESLPVLPGGSPWLVEGRDVPDEEAPETEQIAVVVVEPEIPELMEQEEKTPAIPLPRPGMLPGIAPAPAKPANTRELTQERHDNKAMADTISRLKAENQRLREDRLASDMEASRLAAELKGLRSELAELRAENASQRKAKRAQQLNKSTSFSRRARFASDEDWFVEEIRRAWIGRYSPQERQENYPLRMDRFSFGTEFFPSISSDKLDEDELRKLVRVIVDLITGRNAVEHKHKIHELFDGLGGPQRTRPDNALCWRVRIESGTPQAKRLHYWQLVDGSVEFGWVANHDDDL